MAPLLPPCPALTGAPSPGSLSNTLLTASETCWNPTPLGACPQSARLPASSAVLGVFFQATSVSHRLSFHPSHSCVSSWTWRRVWLCHYNRPRHTSGSSGQPLPGFPEWGLSGAALA